MWLTNCPLAGVVLTWGGRSRRSGRSVRRAARHGDGKGPMPRRLRVGLLIQSTLEYGRGLLRGIGLYMAEQESWAIYHRPGLLFDSLPSRFRDWGPKGIIAQLESPKLIRQVRRMKVPTVDLYALDEIPGIPRLAPDHRAVARMAADYFLERGYNHFAYCGLPDVYYSELRCKHFTEYLEQKGHDPIVYRGPVLPRPPASSTGKRPACSKPGVWESGSADYPHLWRSWPGAIFAPNRCSALARIGGSRCPARWL